MALGDTLAVLGALLTVGFLYKRQQKKNSSLPLPPGPKGLPLVGNVKDMMQKQLWYSVTRWGKEFGESCSLLHLHGGVRMNFCPRFHLLPPRLWSRDRFFEYS